MERLLNGAMNSRFASPKRDGRIYYETWVKLAKTTLDQGPFLAIIKRFSI
jgi:hypothetical protein